MKILFFYIRAFNLILGGSFEIQFLAIFQLRYKRKLNWFWIQKKYIFLNIKVLNLLIGSALKSNFWQYFNCVIKGNWIDFEIEKNNFLVKCFNLLSGFPNNKYPSDNKNYLRCLLFGGAFSIRGKGFLKTPKTRKDMPCPISGWGLDQCTIDHLHMKRCLCLSAPWDPTSRGTDKKPSKFPGRAWYSSPTSSRCQRSGALAYQPT